MGGEWLSALGYQPEDLAGTVNAWKNIVHPDDFPEAKKEMAKHFAKQTHVYESINRVRMKNGQWRWNYDRGRVVEWTTDGKPARMVGTDTDITERKRAEESLQEMNLALTHAAPGISRLDFEGRYLQINKTYATLLGYDPEELLGHAWIPTIHPEDYATAVSAFEIMKTTGKGEFEARAIRKDGSIFYKHVVMVKGIVKAGSQESYHCFMRDITERKNLEAAIQQKNEELEEKVLQRTERIHELEQRRMQVEKLAALAQIAAGVAHEINNPLASISQSLELLKRAISPEHPHFRYMAKVEDCVDRIAKITKHLYQLYRPSSPIPTPIDIFSCIQTATEIMNERTEKYGVHMRISPLSEQVISHASQGELIQILCNLIHNAIDASPPESTIEISLSTGPKTFSIFVTDQGEGIAPEAVAHIFEPFYTTKHNQPEGGMGLGLSISHSLIESMGGMLDFSTTIGHGSTFRITLPYTST